MADIEDNQLPGEDEYADVEAKSAKPWLALITSAEKAFKTYNAKADNIDKLFADLEGLSKVARDRQFQIFWANIEVLKPSVYSRPPVPVVVPRFKDRRPIRRVASEFLERACVTGFDTADIDYLMKLVRDDLIVLGRGVPWVRYETKAESDTPTERVCFEFKNRRDFLHEPARNWNEVCWVAGAAYLSKKEMRKRFSKTSGKAYQDAEYQVRREDRDNGAADNRQKAKVWEIWHRDENKVVWVAEGGEKVLEEAEPHLKLEGFFPCPRPAYGTLQRGSLIPVPDVLYYKDQIEELNELTARIHVLSDAIKVRGFYPAGSGEIGDAIEAALKSSDPRQIMVPVSNWAAFGNGTAKDTIIWLPIDMVASVIQICVELRQRIIDDIYQIMGLSDIMRGQVDPNEKLGQSELKSQYGSVRIRDKVSELVRVARDIVRIAAEIMAENFDKQTLLDMTQMDIPSDADIQRQLDDLAEQVDQQVAQLMQQAMQRPEIAEKIQGDESALPMIEAKVREKVIAQAQPKVEELRETVTIEQVMDFLHDEKLRPFTLDIETDSTIQPDENAEKERRAEFLRVMGTTIQQLGELLSVEPTAAPMASEILKFSLAPYRAGRELEGSIEEFAENMVKKAQQPQPPSPDQIKAQSDAKAAEAQAQKTAADAQMTQAEAQRTQLEAQSKAQQEQQALEVKRQEAADESAARQAKVQDEQAMAALKREDFQRSSQQQAALTERQIALADKQLEKISAEIALKGQQAELAERADERDEARQASEMAEAN